MPHRPPFAEFAALARGHTVVPVYRTLVADALTPVSAFARVRRGGWAFLFESVVGGERVGRYSPLGGAPPPPPPGRPPHPRPQLRLLRPDGDLRPHHQDGERGRARAPARRQ